MLEKYDAVIVGSGAGGGSSAWALATAGLRVLLLEAGPAYSPTDYRLHRSDWEGLGFPAKVDIRERQTFAPLQALDSKWDDLRSWNHLKGVINPDINRRVTGYQHVVGLGGSTLHYTGEAHRFNPMSMQMSSRFGVGADWPLSYDELEPFYTQAEQVVGVAGPNHNPIRFRSKPYPLPAHRLSYASQKLAESGDPLGLEWRANSLAALSAPYDGRPGCNYCANCTRGCPRRDKGSVDVTFIAKARATDRCDVVTDSQVVRILAGPDDRVSGVEYFDALGNLQQVRARAVIVSCGAIETPRLLLLSENHLAVDGLGNESGQVGRHFMETLAWTSSALHPQALGSFRGLPSDMVCWTHNAPDSIPGVIGGCRFSPGTAEADLIGPLNYATRVVGGWGRGHHARMRESFGRVLSVGAIGENLHDPHSYVDLNSSDKDNYGRPKARIHSHLGPMELERLRFMATTSRSILAAAGCAPPFEEYGTYDSFNSTHVFGTCRMGNDPDHSGSGRKLP